jgi:glycine/D-amino acid oxidase-like deaminating enzyme
MLCGFQVVDSGKPQPKIVIIGGGVAGLSAAHKLFESGMKDVLVCEATRR